MNKFTCYLFAAMLSVPMVGANAQVTPVSQMENLSRGVVAVPSASGNGMFVSWRLLGTDDDLTSFDVLRDGNVIKEDISDVTSYYDRNGV